MTDIHHGDVFSDELYASGFWSRAKRSVQLGWRYYLWNLPLYIAQRRSFCLSAFDIEAAVNPLRELFDRKRGVPPRVDGYAEALERLHSSGMRLTLPPSRIAALVNCWQRASGVPGDVIECGSYRGATGLLIALLGKIHSRDQKVLLLDTFQGSPAGSQYDALRRRSEYSLPEGYPEILRRQADALGVGERIEICAGNFRDTFAVLDRRSPEFCFGGNKGVRTICHSPPSFAAGHVGES